jgi:MOSC domain-containing protein YiiM
MAEEQGGDSRVVSIWITPARREPAIAVERSRALTDLGLDGDIHAKAGSDRQVLLMDRETLEALGLAPGDLSENITTEGFPLADQPSGTLLRVGGATLRLTGPCPPCGKMDQIRPGLRQELAGRRGILARVVEGGEIRIGDAVESA